MAYWRNWGQTGLGNKTIGIPGGVWPYWKGQGVGHQYWGQYNGLGNSRGRRSIPSNDTEESKASSRPLPLINKSLYQSGHYPLTAAKLLCPVSCCRPTTWEVTNAEEKKGWLVWPPGTSWYVHLNKKRGQPLDPQCRLVCLNRAPVPTFLPCSLEIVLFFWLFMYKLVFFVGNDCLFSAISYKTLSGRPACLICYFFLPVWFTLSLGSSLV